MFPPWAPFFGSWHSRRAGKAGPSCFCEPFRAAYTWSVDAVALRPRSFVRVAGPDAEDYLQRMLSNDVAALAVGESCEALLLTPKARVIAPMRVLRQGEDDFLLLTEPELGETLRAELIRMRFAAKAEIELEEHTSTLVLGRRRGDPDRGLRHARGRGAGLRSSSRHSTRTR